MLLLSQLDYVAQRFAVYVAEMQEFLANEGFPLHARGALAELSARLREETGFRQDVSGLLRSVLYREREAVSYMDLLGMLVVAAAGAQQDVAHPAEQAAVSEILRFVMETRRAFQAPAPAVSAGGGAVAPVRAVVLSPGLAEQAGGERRASAPAMAEASVREVAVPRFLASEPEPAADEEEAVPTPWWRRPAVAWAAVLLALGGGVWAYRVTGPAPAAAPVVASAPAPETEAVHQVIRARPRRLAGGMQASVTASRKPSAGVPFASRTEARRGRALTSVARVSEGPRRVVLQPWVAPPAAPLPAMRPEAPAHVPEVIRASRNERSVGEEAVVGAAPRSSAEAPAAAVASAASPAYEAPMATERTQPPAPVERRGAPRYPSAPAAAAPGVELPAHRPLPKPFYIGTGNTAAPGGSGTPAAGMSTSGKPGVVHPGSSGTMASNVVYSPAPDYPAAASAAGVQGQVTVRAVVDEEGNVTEARVVSGPEPLRDAALSAVQQWRYRPYYQGGKPVAVATTAILDFQIPE